MRRRGPGPGGRPGALGEQSLWRGCAPHSGPSSCTPLEPQTPLLCQPNSEALSKGTWPREGASPAGPVTRSLGECKCRWRLSAPGEISVRARQPRADAARPRCPARAVRQVPELTLPSLSLPKGLRLAAGMKLVPVALLYLSSLAFLGADAAQLDVASEFRKK